MIFYEDLKKRIIANTLQKHIENYTDQKSVFFTVHELQTSLLYSKVIDGYECMHTLA